MTEKKFEGKAGFIPALPVPSKINQISILMGGYAFGIPHTSAHKDLARKLIQLNLNPEIFGSFLYQIGLLPTQLPMTTRDLLNATASSYPYYTQLVSMIPLAGTLPEYVTILNNMALTYEELGNYEKALKYYDLSLKKHSKNTDILVARANLLSRLDRYDEAIDSYKQALAINPSQIDIIIDLLLLLDSLGKPKRKKAKLECIKAIKVFDAIIQNRPSNVKVLVGKAIALDIRHSRR